MDTAANSHDDAEHTARMVALKLGELLEDLHEELVRLPRWRPAPTRRVRLVGSVEAGLALFRAWQASGA